MENNFVAESQEELVNPTNQKNWIATVCSYFRDFLDTDFKKSRAPKRSITARDRTGLVTGVALSNYPELNRDLLELLSKSMSMTHDGVEESMIHQIKIKRGNYRSRLNKNLLAVINTQVESISNEKIDILVKSIKESTRMGHEKFVDDIESYADNVLFQIRNTLLITFVNPLLTNLDKYFKDKGQDSLESIYNIEEELGQVLVSSFEDGIEESVASAIVNNDFSDLDVLIEDACSLSSIKSRFINFFNTFQTRDFFEDLMELQATLKLKDNFQIYIYACALRVEKSSYPIFYLPVEVNLSKSVFSVKIAPHLLINKKAIDFAISQVARNTGHQPSLTLPERKFYISEEESIIEKMQELLDNITSGLTLNGAINLKEIRKQKVTRTQFLINNDFHFAAFDQSDESLLNDYEELLVQFDKGSDTVNSLMELINKFMFSDPESFEKKIDEEWTKLNVPERLIYESPVPINEEQRKILSAISKKDCRFIAVEGPPGTGKSHTITACVFDSILKGKNVLILSDKKEALDVAENKIRDTLSKVRINKNIQDPILRLGKHGSTYTRIIAPKTINQLTRSNQIAKTNEKDLQKNILERKENIKLKIKQTNDISSAIDMKNIIDIQKSEDKFNYLLGDLEKIFQNKLFCVGVIGASNLFKYFEKTRIKHYLSLLDKSIEKKYVEEFLNIQEKLCKAISDVEVTSEMLKFRKLKTSQLSIIRKSIDKYHEVRMPIFSYLFSKNKLRKINRELNDEFNFEESGDPHSDLKDLEKADTDFRRAIAIMEEFHSISSDRELNLGIYQILNSISGDLKEIETVRRSFKNTINALENDKDKLFKKVGLGLENFSIIGNVNETDIKNRFTELSDHIIKLFKTNKSFKEIPKMDYLSEKTQFEDLQTQKLANILDESVVDFANTQKNKASQIKTIIKKKQKFPLDLFFPLQEAFPVIIAGIRDYAEYVPLENGLFDLVIIDEASQVSIAQALPAFIRAKKILVLGDQNQFSNVKTENASKTMNQAYKSSVIDQFKEEANPNVAMLNQVALFDIKTSVLDFVDKIANFKIMLRKHFRGYPELISFSSKYFYDDNLQAVKIRGKTVDEVLEFNQIDHDGLLELKGNTNQQEADAIVKFLQDLVNKKDFQDVCVITPHSEQQRLILQNVRATNEAEQIIDDLKLRVFTFDTCQGEEANTIIYSMVATLERDRLNYIFARDIKQSSDVEESLRLQRLNVGFSRAKERIIFYHSKPLTEFNGGIQVALNHFKGVLEKGRLLPDPSTVDPSSPMEKKVLSWLNQISIKGELGENMEIDAQFEVGAYLRQLDETYKHPNYKVDFLVKVKGKQNSMQIIIEYDGFKEHFENLSEVDVQNYPHYMKPADVERQKVLESYGYKFIRINRFNMGQDPVKTLDERLRELIHNLDSSIRMPSLIEEHQNMQNSLNNKESKVCKKCEEVKHIEEFFDWDLKDGVGGYGLICTTCKKKD